MKSIVLFSGRPRRGFRSAKKGNPKKALSKQSKLLCGNTIYLTKKFWYWWSGVVTVYDHKSVWVWLSAKLSSTSVNNEIIIIIKKLKKEESIMFYLCKLKKFKQFGQASQMQVKELIKSQLTGNHFFIVKHSLRQHNVNKNQV